MSRSDLRVLFEPRSIAVIGASPDPRRIGGRIVRVLLDGGYAGRLYPVSRGGEPVAGLAGFADIGAIPEPVDLAVVAVGAAQVPDLLLACAEAGAGAAVVVAAGFADNPGEGRDLQEELEKAVRSSGMAVLGPNTNGYVNVRGGIAVTFSPVIEHRRGVGGSRPGRLAIVAQSGGLGFALFEDAEARGVTPDFVIGTGNEVGVDALDCLDYLVSFGGDGPVLLWLEGSPDPSRLAELAGRARAAGRPLVVAKVGRSDAGRRAALSHTAHLAGDARLTDALFRSHGILQAADQEELVDFGLALAGGAVPAGERVAVVTTSGGAGIWMADALADAGFTVPELSAGLQADIAAVIPPMGQPANPVDVTAQILQTKGNLLGVINRLMASDEVDAVVAVSTLASPEPFFGTADELAAALGDRRKPLLVYSYTRPFEANLQLLAAAGVAWFPSSRRAAAALRALRTVAEAADAAEADGADGSPPASPGIVLDALPGGRLSEFDAKQLLATWGIPVPFGRLAADPAAAAAAATEIGFPAVVKAQVPGLVHKTEANAVVLGLSSPAEVEEAARAMMAADGGLPVEAFLVEPHLAGQVEVIAGIVNRPEAGPMVMVGMGGVNAELLDDVVLAACPLTRRQAGRLIGRLRSARLFDGFRGRPPADRDALAGCLAALSRFAVAHRSVVGEVDLNPVIVGPAGSGVWAVDAVVLPAVHAASGGTEP